MQWKSAQIRFLFFSGVVALSTAGCRQGTTESGLSPTPHQGIELRIACPTKEAPEPLLRPARTWALRQGATIRLLPYEPAADPQTAGPADIWLLEPAELPHWAAARRLAAVPERFTARDSAYGWTDLLPTYRDRLVMWDNTAYGWMVVGESPVCCYRKDWLDDPVHQKAFRKRFGRPLAAPVTWEQFACIAEYFHKKDPKKPTPSLPPLPRSDADLDRLFYTVAAGYARRAVSSDEAAATDPGNDLFSFHYDRESGRPRLTTPGFVQALELLQRLQACRPAQPVSRIEEAFRDGRAVLCLTDAPWLKGFQRTAALRDKVGVCRIPGGERYFDYHRGQPHATPQGNRMPYLGGAGWLAAVPRDAEHADAAFDLLAELSGPKTSMQVFLGETERGGPIRGEQLNRERWESFDLDERQTNHLRDALRQTLLHYGLKNPAVCLRTPRQVEHRTALVHQLRAALLQGVKANEALSKAAEAWEQMDRRQGWEAHKADYRRSLGLLVK